MILFLFLCSLPSSDLRTEKQFSLMAQSGAETQEQNDSSSIATSCEEMINRALSLNGSFKNSVSAGGRRALELEVERHFNSVLLGKISSCVTYAATDSNADLSKLVFELAYSYSDSADEVIPLELAGFYSVNQLMTKTVLLDYERNKRRTLIRILKRGLDSLYSGRAEVAPRLKRLNQFLDELE